MTNPFELATGIWKILLFAAFGVLGMEGRDQSVKGGEVGAGKVDGAL